MAYAHLACCVCEPLTACPDPADCPTTIAVAIPACEWHSEPNSGTQWQVRFAAFTAALTIVESGWQNAAVLFPYERRSRPAGGTYGLWEPRGGQASISAGCVRRWCPEDLEGAPFWLLRGNLTVLLVASHTITIYWGAPGGISECPAGNELPCAGLPPFGPCQEPAMSWPLPFTGGAVMLAACGVAELS